MSEGMGATTGLYCEKLDKILSACVAARRARRCQHYEKVEGRKVDSCVFCVHSVNAKERDD